MDNQDDRLALAIACLRGMLSGENAIVLKPRYLDGVIKMMKDQIGTLEAMPFPETQVKAPELMARLKMLSAIQQYCSLTGPNDQDQESELSTQDVELLAMVIRPIAMILDEVVRDPGLQHAEQELRLLADLIEQRREQGRLARQLTGGQHVLRAMGLA